MSIPEYNPRLLGRSCPKCGLIKGFTLQYVCCPDASIQAGQVREEWLWLSYAKTYGQPVPETDLNEWLLFICCSCGYGREMQVENLD